MLCEFYDSFEYNDLLLNILVSYYIFILNKFFGERVFFYIFKCLELFKYMLLCVIY